MIASLPDPSDTVSMDPPMFVLDARFDHGGAWAGVEQLVDAAWCDLRARGHDSLLQRHHYAFHMVLQRRRDRIPLAYASLTDMAVGSERTRNFPLDRAHRIVHALVDVMIAWRQLDEHATPWIVFVRGFDDAQTLARRFFAELARRGAADIAVVTDAGGRPTWLDDRDAALPGAIAARAAEALPGHDLDAAAAIWATHPGLMTDMALVERHHPALIALHREKGDALTVARLSLRALCLYNHFGYYHESGSFVDTVMPYFDTIVGDDRDARWNYVGNIFQGLVMIGRQAEAFAVLSQRAEPYLDRPDLRAKMHYVLAMYHLRYAVSTDVARAEWHLDAACTDIAAAQSTIDPADHLFFSVFIDNGIAFLRVRQGRADEAIALCGAGHARLTRALGDERHRLHRSVLQYNMAQVHAQLGQLDIALDYYRTAIDADPHYSEYYNESGNLLQRLERFDEALAMYALAETYSAPYPELFYNRGVCHAHREHWPAALASLNRALDLDPAQPDALLLRADILSALARTGEALEDIEAALRLAPGNASGRVNRAVLLFEGADYAAALSDMDVAIDLEPGVADHFDNRAAVLEALGEADRSRADRAIASALRLAA